MNIFCNAKGNVFYASAEKIYQGSIGVNEVCFIGEFPSSAQVLMAYRLPNGDYRPPIMLVRETTLDEVQDARGGLWSVWKGRIGATVKTENGEPVKDENGNVDYYLDPTITEHYGTASLRFFVYGANGKITTEEVNFTIEKGLPIYLDINDLTTTTSAELLLEQILAAVERAYSNNNNGSSNINGTVMAQAFTAYVTGEGGTTYGASKIASNKGNLFFPNSLFNHGHNGTIALEEDVAPIKEQVEVVTKAITQSGVIYTADETATWGERTTAGGKNVLDASKAILKKVIGNTVTCNNLLNVSVIPLQSENSNCWISSIKDNVIEIKSPSGYSGNGYTPTNKKLSELCPGIKAGDTVYAYFDTTGVPQIYLPSLGTWSSGTPKTITATTLSENLVLYGATTGDTTVKLMNLRITKVKDAPWQAYFTGAKSARFGGIESTDANGTQAYSLEFPATDTPTGTEIDFVNKTVTVNGVTTAMTASQTELLDFVADENGNNLGVAYRVYKLGKEQVVGNNNGIYGANNTMLINYVYVTGVK